jgi:AcrR family transcriptional regulator
MDGDYPDSRPHVKTLVYGLTLTHQFFDLDRIVMRAKKSLTKDDWVERAMEVLRVQGVGGVRVLSLARSLGVTRGSFYWHFRDRRDLLHHMLDWWDRKMTGVVIQHIDQLEGTGSNRILALAELILRKDLNRYDSAVRSWAEGDREAAAAFGRVMNKRLGYVAGLFRDAGFSPRDAAARGHILAIYLMGEGAVRVGASLQTRLRFLRREVRVLTEPV